MPNGDPQDGFFYPTLTLMMDFFYIIRFYLYYIIILYLTFIIAIVTANGSNIGLKGLFAFLDQIRGFARPIFKNSLIAPYIFII